MAKEEFLRRAEIREECLQDWEDGMAIRVMPVHTRHGYFIGILFGLLNSYVRGGKVRQEAFVDFGARTFGVDLVVLFAEHTDRLVDGRVKGCPDLIVEVLSPDSIDRDRTVKFDYYYNQGVPWYWIGDPVAGILEEYRYSADGYVRTASGSLDSAFQPKAVAGLSVVMADLLED